jgi:hypothetical protein
LAAENAELYKRVDHLEHQLKQKDARFEAWAREMAWPEEVMKSRMEKLEHALTELSASRDPRGRRVDEPGTFAGEKSQPEPGRSGKAASEIAALGAAAGSLAGAIGAVAGSTVSADAGGIAGGVLGIFGAGVALVHKLREEGREDRRQG